MERKIEISQKTIFFIAGFLALLWALYQIREVIILLFISIIFMSALSPIVDNLQRIKLPKSLAITVTYLGIIAFIAILISAVIVPFREQTVTLFANLPQKIEGLFPEQGPINRSIVQDELNTISQNAIGFSLALFNNVIALISVLVLTFYLLIERDRLDDLIAQFFVRREARVKSIIRRIEEKLGAWLRGQIVLSLIIGFMAYFAMLALGVPYALPLAILAGLMETVPVIGPIISSIPAILVAYLTTPILGLFVAIAFFVIQQLENNLIVPQVMNKAVGLNPLIVLLAVAIGGKLIGIPGALLAVPVAVVVQIVLEEMGQLEKEK